MKILHTSDWHLGQSFFQYERYSEHENFITQLIDIVKCELPDALIISGDVYHTATPSNTAMRFFTDSIVKLHLVAPEMAIIITAGNHDSCARLEATSEVWRLANVFVVGGVKRNIETQAFEITRHVISLPNKGFVLAIPFVMQNNNDIFTQVQEYVSENNPNNLPVVMMGHLALSGTDAASHADDIVGGMERVVLNDISSYYDYFALGHIHFPRTLANQKARYCGSPIPINFDEDFIHSVSIVEIDKHGSLPNIRHIDIKQTMQFYTVPQQPLPFEEALAELTTFYPEKEGYLRLNVAVTDYAPSNAEIETQRVVAQKDNIKFCYIKIERERKKTETHTMGLSVQEIKEINPIDLAQTYYQDIFKNQLEEEAINLLMSVVESVKTDEQINIEAYEI